MTEPMRMDRKIRAHAAELGGAVDRFERWAKEVVTARHPILVQADNPALAHLARGTFVSAAGARLRVRGASVLFPNLVLELGGRHWSDLCLARPDVAGLVAGHEELAVASGVTIPANNNFHNYSHFLQECLPAILEARRDPDAAMIVIPALTERFQGEAMRALGIDPGRLTQVARGLVRFDHVDIYDFADHSRARWELWPRPLAAMARDLVDRAAPGARGRRLFLSRREAARRPCLATDWLASVLAPLGFREVDPGALSFLDQVRLFAEATDVVGLHGAGLANIMFCRPDTRVLEFMPPWLANSAFARLSVQFGLKHAIYQEFDPAARKGHRDPWDIADRVAAEAFIRAALAA
jgi:capsular polysaccharide biosynthesis protein